MDQMTLRRIYGSFPSSVVVVCARVGNHFVGMTLSTFIPVSLEPPLVAISVRQQSTTWPVLATAPRLGLAMLAAGHESTARRLSLPASNRFTGVSMEVSGDGAAWVADAPVVLTCSIDSQVTAGDHLLVVLAVHQIVRQWNSDPLIFHAREMRPLGRRADDLVLVEHAS